MARVKTPAAPVRAPLRTGEKLFFAAAGGLLVAGALTFFLLLRVGHDPVLWPAHLSPSAQHGMEVFRAGSCSDCHLVYNLGESQDGPNLGGEGGRRSLSWIQTYLADPDRLRPGSGAVHTELPRLSPQDKAALADFLFALKEQPTNQQFQLPTFQD
jgi:mono/diheme cytochrome c family protein